MHEIEEPQETREAIEERYRKALDAAGKQLSYRALSVRALRDKLLEKGHAEDASEYAVAWLLGRKLLNDAELAAAMVRSYSRKGYGALRIRQELLRHGIGREETEEALSSFVPEIERLTALLDKRLRGDVSDRREVEKAVAALQRRGFRWEEIRRALAGYEASLDGTPEE